MFEMTISSSSALTAKYAGHPYYESDLLLDHSWCHHDSISFVGQLLLGLSLLPAMKKDNTSSP